MSKKQKIVVETVETPAVETPVQRVMFNSAEKWKNVKVTAMDKKSNRAAFLRRAEALDGVTVPEWLASMDADMPATPTARAKKTEAYTGRQWLTWMVAARIVTIA
jgi:hypothetical protein